MMATQIQKRQKLVWLRFIVLIAEEPTLGDPDDLTPQSPTSAQPGASA
jgi:hypothetical protein